MERPDKPSLRERAALEIVWRLRHAGHRAYWVGGCVRNRLLGLPPKDIDVATDARPDQITALFNKVLLVGVKFGVCVVVLGKVQTEVATFRTEGPYSDHRRPESVTFSGPREDARRRDFTINALFYDPIENRIIDYVGGRADLKARLIRCVGDPDARLSEDALRVLRAVRFAARLDFNIEENTRRALVHHASELRSISAERIREELLGMICGPHPERALDLLHETGCLGAILPEVEALRGVAQPPEFHPEGDVWEHTRRCLELLKRPSPVLAMATLLHDVGKPPTFQPGPDRIRFNNHADVGANLAAEICRRLRFSKADCDAIEQIIRRHMSFMNIQRMRPATSARFLAAPTIDEEVKLHRVDCLASHGDLENYRWATERLKTARAVCPQIIPPPLLTGRDLIEMGFHPGPIFTEILKELETRQLEGDLKNPDQARSWVRSHYPKS